MNGHNFTIKAQEALQRAHEIAIERGHQQIEPLHLLASVLADADSAAAAVLENMGVSLDEARERIRRALGSLPRIMVNVPFGQVYLTPELARILERAKKEAERMSDEFISVEHLFLALLDTPSRAREALTSLRGADGAALSYELVEKALKNIRGSDRVTDERPETKYKVLERYARNLTELARKEKLDPVIGRDAEIRRLMQVLSRRTKNNPVLIGEAGVGKTAIVEGLAQRIASGDVPESLREKELFQLDISALIAGAAFRGEFEERLKSVLKAITESGKYILFI